MSQHPSLRPIERCRAGPGDGSFRTFGSRAMDCMDSPLAKRAKISRTTTASCAITLPLLSKPYNLPARPSAMPRRICAAPGCVRYGSAPAWAIDPPSRFGQRADSTCGPLVSVGGRAPKGVS